MILGEMSVLLTEGRVARPQRLLDAGFQFQYADLKKTMNDLLG
jgi:NAD dependent epimerase/dehydratase family enzyme